MTDTTKKIKRTGIVPVALTLASAAALAGAVYLVASRGMTAEEVRQREAYITLADPSSVEESKYPGWSDVQFTDGKTANVILPTSENRVQWLPLDINGDYSSHKPLATNLLDTILQANPGYESGSELEGLRDVIANSAYDHLRVSRTFGRVPEQNIRFASGLVEVGFDKDCKLDYVWFGVLSSSDDLNAADKAKIAAAGSLHIEAGLTGRIRHFRPGGMDAERSLGGSSQVSEALGWVSGAVNSELDKIRAANDGFPSRCEDYGRE